MAKFYKSSDAADISNSKKSSGLAVPYQPVSQEQRL